LSFLPEGGLTIARQLTAGFAIAIALSPNGTAEYLVLLKKHPIAYDERFHNAKNVQTPGQMANLRYEAVKYPDRE
jgi:hypothetical protein